MATILHVQGADIELDENFDKVRHRLNAAFSAKIDYENGNLELSDDDKYQPFHTLSFKMEGDGRISVNIEKVIGVSSDLPKDTA